MYKDPTEFRARFKAYKEGKMPYENGLPKYGNGTPGLTPDEAFVESMGPLLYRELLYQGVENPDSVYNNLIHQLAYESNRGRSNVAKKQHNYGGVGWNGKRYFSYKNDADFVHDYVKLMNGRYRKAIAAPTLSEYAAGIKKLGYFEDTLENYSRNLNGMKSLARAAIKHRLSNPDLYKIDVLRSAPETIVNPVDNTKVVNTIPAEQTHTRWEGTLNVSPYLTGKPPLILNPPTKLPSVTDHPVQYNSWFENRKSNDIKKMMDNTLSLLFNDEDSDDLLYAKDGKLPKYDDGTSGRNEDESTQKAELWADDWLFRLLPAARSKVILQWNATGNKPEPESAELYTLRRIKQTEWKKPSGRKMLEIAPAAVDFVPISGDVKLGLEAAYAAIKKDYLTAGLLGGSVFIPGVFDKVLKWFPKNIKRLKGVVGNKNNDSDLSQLINNLKPIDIQPELKYVLDKMSDAESHNAFGGNAPLENFMARNGLTLDKMMESRYSTENFIDLLLLDSANGADGYFSVAGPMLDAYRVITGDTKKILGPDEVSEIVQKMAKGDKQALQIRLMMINDGGFSAYDKRTGKIHIKPELLFRNPFGPEHIPIKEQIEFGHEYGHKLFQDENIPALIALKAENMRKDLRSKGLRSGVVDVTGFDPYAIEDESIRNYLMDDYFNEIFQRVSQWKDFKGIQNPKQQLTGNDIIDIMYNYRKITGEDNNMTELIKGIRDPNKFALFFSPFAKTTIPIMAVGTAAGLSLYKNGKSPIHIKPANRGKLTRLKARTGKSESELYNDGNPAHKKMVVFARSSRKWHKG